MEQCDRSDKPQSVSKTISGTDRKNLHPASPGAVLIREKDLTREDYAHLAARVYDICRSHHVPCIYHSFIDEACSAGAEMIHLPLHLLRKYAGRPILTEFGKIGTSVHSREEAEEAAALGASYMTAGHIFATDCKKGLPPRGLPFLRSVCEAAEIPVYAIGGIHYRRAGGRGNGSRSGGSVCNVGGHADMRGEVF